MITFKQFIKENYSVHTLTGGLTIHSHNVHGHDLQVWFNHHGGPKDVSVDFFVGTKRDELSTQRHGSIPKKHRLAMMTKVKKSVHDFINKEKPTSLQMVGNTQRKQKMYAKFANHLNKKYGAKRVLTPGDYDGIKVNFPRHERYWKEKK